MASRYGARPTGTDGSDFRHRQRVALHYRESLTNKFRLKCAIGLHSSLLVLMFLKLLEDILDRFEIDLSLLERLKVPVPSFWEYWWMFSALPCIVSLTALPRNNARRLRQCYYGFFLFALIPLAIGAGTKVPELMNYMGYGREDEDDDEDGGQDAVDRFLGLPMVVVWFMFFAVALQVHAFTMYFITLLIKGWQPVATQLAPTSQQSISGSVSTEKLAGNDTAWKNDKKVR